MALALGAAGRGRFAPCPAPLVPGLVPGAASSLPRRWYPFPLCTTGRLPCSVFGKPLKPLARFWLGLCRWLPGLPQQQLRAGLGRVVRVLSPGTVCGGDGEAGQGVSSWHGCRSRMPVLLG